MPEACNVGRGQRLRHYWVRSTAARYAVTPHVAQNDANRRSAIDARTTRHEGYPVSQRKQTGGRSIRLDEDGGIATQNAIPRAGANGLDVYACSGGIQPGEDAQSSARRRIGRSVSGGRKTALRTRRNAEKVPLKSGEQSIRALYLALCSAKRIKKAAFHYPAS